MDRHERKFKLSLRKLVAVFRFLELFLELFVIRSILIVNVSSFYSCLAQRPGNGAFFLFRIIFLCYR